MLVLVLVKIRVQEQKQLDINQKIVTADVLRHVLTIVGKTVV